MMFSHVYGSELTLVPAEPQPKTPSSSHVWFFVLLAKGFHG